MNRSLHVKPAATADVDNTAMYIAEDNPSAGQRFLAAVDECFGRLLTMPKLGREYDLGGFRLTELRSLPISGFANWLVFYRVTEDGIEIVRVLHGARDVDAVLLTEEDEPSSDLN